MSRYGWKPYVPVAARRAKALKKMEKLRKRGVEIKPVVIEGRTIARTFWGKAWCDHLESFGDYANRLPRGRSYVRNGSVCHLDIAPGVIDALVSGTSLYTVTISIRTLPAKRWNLVKERCAGQIGSIIELLQGKISASVMSVVADRNDGLFPRPGEINLECSCPDWATMCKHVAAALYGVGSRLDEAPELLFILRGVDVDELAGAEVEAVAAVTKSAGTRRRIAPDALEEVFDIDIAEEPSPTPAPRKSARRGAGGSRRASETNRETGAKRARKRSPIGAGSETRDRKPQAEKSASRSRKPSTGNGSDTPSASRAHRVTGKSVAALRAKFGMSQSEFARLLGVSVPSVGIWEKKTGTLTLRKRTLAALVQARKFTKREALRKLDESSREDHA